MSWFKPSFKKHLIWLLPLAAFLALAVLMKFSGSGQTVSPPVEAKKHLAHVVSVKRQQSYQQRRFVSGKVEAPQTADVGFELAGLVKQILVDEGDVVKQGQVLANLNTQTLNAQLVELSAMQKRAKAEANLAALSHKRVVELVAKKLEPAQRLDESEQSLNMANAFVEELAARKQSLQIEVNKTQLLAPFEGSVVERLVDHGTVINAGQRVFRLQQNSLLHARFAMPTDYAQSFSVGSSLKLKSGNHELVGQIKSVSGLRRIDTRTVDVIVSLFGSNESLIPGDLVSLELSNQIVKEGIWIPRKALVSGVRGLWGVFVAKAIDDGHQLNSRLVEIIYADQDKVYVNGTLNNGELIVINGVQRLVPDQKVRLITNRPE